MYIALSWGICLRHYSKLKKDFSERHWMSLVNKKLKNGTMKAIPILSLYRLFGENLGVASLTSLFWRLIYFAGILKEEKLVNIGKQLFFGRRSSLIRLKHARATLHAKSHAWHVSNPGRNQERHVELCFFGRSVAERSLDPNQRETNLNTNTLTIY